ncbi:hypothetical protein HUN01_22495 [Nostoc edaphicum CCNP1411]|uniref:Uncharacterized protein n=1 Tax=Nostoc edaphicum CCNP1411 TaxID=1472755 RepID=A0A7D7QHC1_9NOSO|nr:hypothetical protein [Nostoc edaphicum]QMS90222.1 hypothetical protein HUN01_22495 [Nostoc edaphicum CCNP1411]
MLLKIVNACGMLLQFFEILNNFQGKVAVATPVVDIAIKKAGIGAGAKIKLIFR